MQDEKDVLFWHFSLMELSRNAVGLQGLPFTFSVTSKQDRLPFQNLHTLIIYIIVQELLPGEADVQEELGDLVDQEMQSTTDAIDKAALRIAVSVSPSLSLFTRSIIDKCTRFLKEHVALDWASWSLI